MKRILNKIGKKKWKVVGSILFGVVLINIVTTILFGENIVSLGVRPLLDSVLNTKEINEVSIKSSEQDYDSRDGGSWKVEVDSKWVDKTQVEVNLNLQSRSITNKKSSDFVVVLDVSGSMAGERINNLKTDINELNSELLSNDDNRVALISYSSRATLLSGFTKDKSVLESKVDSLVPGGDTNYNDALKKVSEVLRSDHYTSQEDRNLVVLFFTDGYPNVDSPSQVGEYEYLKTEYPNLKVIGVQYEIDSPIKELETISDEQVRVSATEVKDKLFNVFNVYLKYTRYVVEMDIEESYFNLDSLDDIGKNQGNVRLDGNKLYWEFDNLTTGSKANLKFYLRLKDNLSDKEGFYRTSKGISVNYKIEEDSKNYAVTSRESTVLKRPYSVTYEVNIPDTLEVSGECNLKGSLVDKYHPYDVVSIRDDELFCSGYQFKGWEIADKSLEGLVRLNDEKFVMPSHDVVIRAIWSKVGISKTMHGSIHEKHKLTQQIVTEANNLNGIKVLEGTEEAEHPIYYYTSDVKGGYKNNNFVIFGGFCFKILRTTETGGIKLIYDGVPDGNGVCPYYGNGKMGKDAQLESTSVFNENVSIGSVGYMNNKNYVSAKKQMSENKSMVASLSNVSRTNYYYSDTVSYDPVTKKYTLDEPKQYGTWSDHYSEIVEKGRYTCRYDNTNACEYIYYFFNGAASRTLYVTLSKGDLIEDATVTLAKSYTGSNPYQLNDTITISYVEWSNNYTKYNNYYACSDYKTTSGCTNLYYIISTTSTSLRYVNMDSIFKYGNRVRYENGVYTLTEEKAPMMRFWDWQANYNKLSNNHYTCFNASGVCSEVYYIHYATNSTAYYVTLKNGEDITGAMDLMIGADTLKEIRDVRYVNKNDSSIKAVVDKWYEENMVPYTAYLEDTVYCNERGINLMGSWRENGGPVTSSSTNLMFFSSYKESTGLDKLVCTRDIDKFSVDKIKGNGDLTYPVGLLDYYEADLIGNIALRTGSSYWTMSPYYFKGTDFSYEGYNWYIYSSGDLDNALLASSYGVRPVITLIRDIEYTRGNGSYTNPYVVDIL